MADKLAGALKLLPHGPEFRFVDRLVSLAPGKSGVGEYFVRGDEPWLPGHFPDQPLLPGVLLVEAAAQLAGVVAQNDPSLPKLEGMKLTALRAVKIRGSARPGQTVRIEASITGRLGQLVQAKAACFVLGAEVMSAELTLSGMAEEPKAPAPGGRRPKSSYGSGR
jgi:3-hydroxyacyl-[acyl-carrier-protein] dehydratase